MERSFWKRVHVFSMGSEFFYIQIPPARQRVLLLQSFLVPEGAITQAKTRQKPHKLL